MEVVKALGEEKVREHELAMRERAMKVAEENAKLGWRKLELQQARSALRLLPAIRTFIAFPAGVARMNMTRFTIYTFAGSLPWCLGLAYIGQKLGEQWDKNDTLKTWFHRFDFLIGIAGLLFVAWWVWRHIKHSRMPSHTEKAEPNTSVAND